MPDQHAGIQQIGNFDRVWLNRQWRIDAAASDDHLNRQTRSGPHGKVFHRAHRARARGRREHACTAECRTRTLRHDGKFALAAEIVADIAFGKQLANKAAASLCGVIGYAIMTSQLARRRASLMTSLPGIERGIAGRVVHHLPGICKCLTLFILCPDLGFCFRHGLGLLSIVVRRVSNRLSLVGSTSLGRCQPWFHRAFSLRIQSPSFRDFLNGGVSEREHGIFVACLSTHRNCIAGCAATNNFE